jgi:hypothetical protein
MKLLAHIASAVAIAAMISAAWAQTPAPMFGPWSGASYPDPYSYRLVAPTPEDAYRQGLINRWELEQLEGPTPQALQGPSPNGDRSAPGR